MKHLRTFGLAVAAVVATTAFAAGSASATTLEVNGIAQNGGVSLSASLKSGGKIVVSRTDGTSVNDCASSEVGGTTSSFTGSQVTGALATLKFASCPHSVTVHNAGQLYIQHISGTTNGTVGWENGVITVYYPYVFNYVTCSSGAGTHIGTLTGTASGHAVLHINAVLNCGFLLVSATWKGTYAVTSPTGLGVIA